MLVLLSSHSSRAPEAPLPEVLLIFARPSLPGNGCIDLLYSCPRYSAQSHHAQVPFLSCIPRIMHGCSYAKGRDLVT